MIQLPLRLACVLVLLAGAAAAGEQVAPRTTGVEPAPAEAARPPAPAEPRTSDDAALLKAMQESYVALVGERARAQKLLQELGAAKYDERLAAMAKEGGPEERARAETLWKRLVPDWNGELDALSRPPNMDTRLACREQETLLRQSAQGAPGSPVAARLRAARKEARACFDRLAPALQAIRDANRKLQASTAEARTMLAASRPAAGGNK